MVRGKFVAATVHVKFVRDLYKIQMDAGKYFLHEHLVNASSWREGCVKRVSNVEGVIDSCRPAPVCCNRKEWAPCQEASRVHSQLGERCE